MPWDMTGVLAGAVRGWRAASTAAAWGTAATGGPGPVTGPGDAIRIRALAPALGAATENVLGLSPRPTADGEPRTQARSKEGPGLAGVHCGPGIVPVISRATGRASRLCDRTSDMILASVT
jgi:hypothetical protein